MIPYDILRLFGHGRMVARLSGAGNPARGLAFSQSSRLKAAAENHRAAQRNKEDRRFFNGAVRSTAYFPPNYRAATARERFL
jgi:hypothetical protein